MKVFLPGLAPVQLEKIADALERPAFNGDVEAVVSRLSLGIAATGVAESLTHWLSELSPVGVARALRAVAAERRDGRQAADRRLELVWTGPERDATATRDTAVVVRELFSSAETDVLVAGYALYNARSIFEPLADRMVTAPSIRVRVVVNITFDAQGPTIDATLSAFRNGFRKHHWPDAPLPAVYYDPRALNARPESRAVMHAKCVVVDGERCFLTSANLTEAAQGRNIELGVIVNDTVWCKGVIGQFDDLIARGDLRRLDF